MTVITMTVMFPRPGSHLRCKRGRTVLTAVGSRGDDGMAGGALSPGPCRAPSRAGSCCREWMGTCSCTGLRAAAAAPELWPHLGASLLGWSVKVSPLPPPLEPSLHMKGRSSQLVDTNLRTHRCLSDILKHKLHNNKSRSAPVVGPTWVVLHHDRRHASVPGVVRLVAVAVCIRSVYVGHVSLVLCQVGRELQVRGACLLSSTTVLLWSPALPPLLYLLLQETFLGPLPLFFPLPVTLSFSVLFPPLILLTFRSFGVFAGVNVGP